MRQLPFIRPGLTGSQTARRDRPGLPPLVQQQGIVRQADALFVLVDQIEVRFQKAKA